MINQFVSAVELGCFCFSVFYLSNHFGIPTVIFSRKYYFRLENNSNFCCRKLAQKNSDYLLQRGKPPLEAVSSARSRRVLLKGMCNGVNRGLQLLQLDVFFVLVFYQFQILFGSRESFVADQLL